MVEQKLDTINYKMPFEGRGIRNFADNKKVNELLGTHLDSGTHFAIAHLPLPLPIEEKLYSESTGSEIAQLVNDYCEAGFTMSYWEFTKPLPFANFIDNKHMNYRGSQVYSKWLAEKIIYNLSLSCR